MKTKQLQIRVSPEEKAQILAQAKRAGVPVSEWVLDRVLSPAKLQFHKAVSQIPVDSTYAFAALNELLQQLKSSQFSEAVADLPSTNLSSFELNYLAAMVQHTAKAKGARSPSWVYEIPTLTTPHFGSKLKSLQLHLLKNSPPAFKARNIFIDSTVGDRV